ncbi:Unknown protein [Striga hermonthica]|uniref:Myb/SANT-like domain-containing protein n=1 Tax=Striga hermonthica TaxID=68872 RepID=A0A9N7RRX6_STRHE|nr:Unknown protein [Striga hermonthica]
MMGTSGFGWSEIGNMLDVKDPEWKAYLKVQPKVKSMRLKSWPFYADWVEIFGKDRATGEGARGFTDAVNDVLLNKDTQPIPVHTTPPHVPNNTFDPLHENVMESSSAQGGENSVSSKGKRVLKRQREVQQVDSQIVGMLSSLCANANDRLAEIAKGAVFQNAAKEQRQSVYEALHEVPELSTGDKVAVARYLCKNNDKLDLFFTLDSEAKFSMVQQILQDLKK